VQSDERTPAEVEAARVDERARRDRRNTLIVAVIALLGVVLGTWWTSRATLDSVEETATKESQRADKAELRAVLDDAAAHLDAMDGSLATLRRRVNLYDGHRAGRKSLAAAGRFVRDALERSDRDQVRLQIRLGRGHRVTVAHEDTLDSVHDLRDTLDHALEATEPARPVMPDLVGTLTDFDDGRDSFVDAAFALARSRTE
jgi:hypothetical protein